MKTRPLFFCPVRALYHLMVEVHSLSSAAFRIQRTTLSCVRGCLVSPAVGSNYPRRRVRLCFEIKYFKYNTCGAPASLGWLPFSDLWSRCGQSSSAPDDTANSAGIAIAVLTVGSTPTSSPFPYTYLQPDWGRGITFKLFLRHRERTP